MRKMKRTITSIVIGAIITVAGISSSEAFWFVKAKNEMNKIGNAGKAGRDSRVNSHNVSRSKNVINGFQSGAATATTSGTSNNGSASASSRGGGFGFGFGWGRRGAAASASTSGWSNTGIAGNGGNTVTSGGIGQVGDQVSTGHTYMGSDAIQANKEVEIKRLSR